mmetsp:Transcript_64596/g.150220  ORF Transcript_64596/g.150220 Transcript_64596/m.150220 type:complete len:387 (-) Transcript_64596:187-1347(-)
MVCYTDGAGQGCCGFQFALKLFLVAVPVVLGGSSDGSCPSTGKKNSKGVSLLQGATRSRSLASPIDELVAAGPAERRNGSQEEAQPPQAASALQVAGSTAGHGGRDEASGLYEARSRNPIGLLLQALLHGRASIADSVFYVLLGMAALVSLITGFVLFYFYSRGPERTGSGFAGFNKATAFPTAGKAAKAELVPATLAPVVGPDTYFCTDLVVPRNSECLLLVPVRPLGRGSFEITDTHKMPVLFVTSAQEHTSEQPKFVLSAGDGIPLAQFGTTLNASGPQAEPEFQLRRGQGDLFARLKRGEGQERYTLRTITDTRLYFWGAFAQRAVNVTDDEGRLLATTEPVSAESPVCKDLQAYMLRVAPLMDVGLVLSGLLCIDHLAKGR